MRSVVEGKRHHLGVTITGKWDNPETHILGQWFWFAGHILLFEHVDVIEISAVNQGISTKLFPKAIEIMIC